MNNFTLFWDTILSNLHVVVCSLEMAAQVAFGDCHLGINRTLTFLG